MLELVVVMLSATVTGIILQHVPCRRFRKQASKLSTGGWL